MHLDEGDRAHVCMDAERAPAEHLVVAPVAALAQELTAERGTPALQQADAAKGHALQGRMVKEKQGREREAKGEVQGGEGRSAPSEWHEFRRRVDRHILHELERHLHAIEKHAARSAAEWAVEGALKGAHLG